MTHKPVLLLNVGPTRADGISGVEKIDIASGIVLPDVVKNILCMLPLSNACPECLQECRPFDVFHNQTIQKLMTGGITTPTKTNSQSTGT
jgi:hypothetical protein